MAEKMHPIVNFHYTRLKPALGAKIVSILIEDMDGEHVVGFVLEKGGKKFSITAMADAEGNGPGWMEFNDENDGGGDS